MDKLCARYSVCEPQCVRGSMWQPTWDFGQEHKPDMKQAKDASSKTKTALKVGKEQVRVHHLVLSHKVNDCGRLGIPCDALHAQEGCTIQLMQHTLLWE